MIPRLPEFCAARCGRPRFPLLATCYRHATKETLRILRAMVDPAYMATLRAEMRRR